MPEKSPPPSGGTAKQGGSEGEFRAAGTVVLPPSPAGRRPAGVRRPLPDAVAVRLLIVPESAPPFDDEQDADAAAQAQGAHRGAGAAEAAGAPLAGGAPGADGATEAAGAPGRARDGWPSQFAQVLAETLAGARSPRQLTPWTTEHARRRIRQLGPLLAGGQQPQLRRVMASSPSADVVEMTVIVRFGPRVRFLAIRLERERPPGHQPGPYQPGPQQPQARTSRWLCTALEAA
ncbi:MAG: Rv3235 family protein [Streptosporangiaceae bacterium]